MHLYTAPSVHLIHGDSSDPAVRHLALRLAGPRHVTIVDPPYGCRESLWVPWIGDPSIVFGTGRMLRRIPDHLYRFERVLLKPVPRRSATIKIMQQHVLVAQCGTVRTLPARGSYQGVWRSEDAGQRKPVDLLTQHVRCWTPPVDVILDPFAGSGSSIEAAGRLGLRAVAIERDAERIQAILDGLRSRGQRIRRAA